MADYPDGTQMVFLQSAAPVGWTKLSDYGTHGIMCVKGRPPAGQDDITGGYIYTGPDGSLNYTPHDPYLDKLPPGYELVFMQTSPPPGWMLLDNQDGPGILCRKGGHEAAGPQKTDASDFRALEKETTAIALTRMKKSIEDERRGADIADAISALHRQHTTNGRPARYLPEA